MINVETFTDFSFGTNSYLVWKEGSEEAVLIDPGLSASRILEFLKSNGLTLTVVLLTHGHPDHIVDAASGTFGVRLKLPNPGYKLPAGLKCRVRFPTKIQ